ncbi:hypothetical protein DL95DRAFT_273092, partial [Leptodontidium sp. 2 PMI_412]
IIAVHGLGDWEETWTDNTTNKMWSRDFVPEQLKNARVMSFDYDSAHALPHSVADINDSVIDIISRLDGERHLESIKKRPIIFVTHSLGDVVVK